MRRYIEKKAIEPRNVLWLTTSNGYGSTNTVIRRYLNITRQIGKALSYVDSATNGMSVTVNENGIYFIAVRDSFTGASGTIGISLNSTELTTAIFGITTTDVLMAMSANDGFSTTGSATINLKQGDVIRSHGDGVAGTAARAHFIMVKLST